MKLDRRFKLRTYRHLMCHKFMLSVMFINGYFVILGLLLFVKLEVAADQRNIITMLVLLLTREMPTIFHHYFKTDEGTRSEDTINKNT